MSVKKILFVSHDSYRAGATIFLLNIQRWLLQNTSLKFVTLLRQDGEMHSEFRKYGATYVWQPENNETSRIKITLKKFWRVLRRKNTMTLQKLIDSDQFDLIYLNTITVGDVIEKTNLRGIPVITHVHELSLAIKTFARNKEQIQIDKSDLIIAVSDAVAQNLVANHGCPGTKLRKIYGFIPAIAMLSVKRSGIRESMLREVGIPKDAFVIGCCGFGDYRKGVDLMVPLARQLPQTINGREIHMLWIGALAPEYAENLLSQEAKRVGISSRVHLLGQKKNALDWISILDLHILLAREDPFPLVVLEAAALGIPTVCFDGSGGAVEFVQRGAGMATDYLDLARMVTAIELLLTDEEARTHMGEIARETVVEKHDESVIMPQILALISSRHY